MIWYSEMSDLMFINITLANWQNITFLKEFIRLWRSVFLRGDSFLMVHRWAESVLGGTDSKKNSRRPDILWGVQIFCIL